MPDKGPGRRLRIGYFVFGALVGIKIAEYFITNVIDTGDWPFLALLAIVSAWLILYFYKHIYHLWRSSGEDNG